MPGVTRDLTLPIRSPRLTLRALREADRSEHARLFRDENVLRYLYDDVMDDAALDEHFAKRWWRGLPGEGEWGNLVVEHDGVFIGHVGFVMASRVHRTCEIGYGFLPEFSGQGFATEAARVAVDIAVDVLDAHRVIARLDARNTASKRLLERLGMRQEAHLRENEFVKGEWCDELVYATLARDWSVTTNFD
jgi:RimJ/RimL family protein N-acetyltransferase